MKKKVYKIKLNYIILLIGLLMWFVPIILDVNFFKNAISTDATVTEIKPYTDSDGDTRYFVTLQFEVNNTTYSKTLTYGKVDFAVNDLEKIIYNPNNPNQFTNSSDIGIHLYDIFPILGLFISFFTIAFIIYNKDLNKINNSFKKNIKNNILEQRLTLLFSSILTILAIYVIYIEFNNTGTVPRLLYFSMWFIGIISIPVLFYSLILSYSMFKLKHDEIYPILLNEQIEKSFIDWSMEVYFTKDCIIDLSIVFKKIYYKDIALVDIQSQRYKIGKKNFLPSNNKIEVGGNVLVVDKNLKRRTIGPEPMFYTRKKASRNY